MEASFQGYGLLVLALFAIFIVMTVIKKPKEKSPPKSIDFERSEVRFKTTLPLTSDESGGTTQQAVLTAFDNFLNASIEYDTSKFTERDFHLFNRLIYDAFCHEKKLEKHFNDNEMILAEHKKLFDRNKKLIEEVSRLKHEEARLTDENKTLYHNYESLEKVFVEKSKLVEELLAKIETLKENWKQALDGFEDLRLKYAIDVQSLRDESDSIQVKLNETEEKYQRSRSDVAELSQRISDMQSVTHEQQIKHMHEEGGRLVQVQLDRNAKLQERIRELTDLNTALAERCHGQSEALAGRAMKQFPKEEAAFVEKVKAALPEMLPHDPKIFCDTCKQPLKLVPTKHRHTWHCSVCSPNPVSE